jgi:uncharacterized protein (TIGR02147 family)
MDPSPPLTPYGYLDGRKFLADWFARKKCLNAAFSYRVFCRKAGINSPGLVSEVLAGTRPLSRSYAERFAQGMALDGAERSYFLDLIAFTQARTDAARREYYGRLLSAMPLRVHGLRRSQWEYFSKWHHVAVREALAVLDVEEDYSALGAALRPPIPASEAKAAISLLAELGLIARDAAGRWKACHASLETPGDESQSLLFRAYRKEMLARAADALDREPPGAQVQTCTTLSVSPQGLQRIQAHLDEFHRRVLETVQADRGEDRVMQLNIQLFPLASAGGGHAG